MNRGKTLAIVLLVITLGAMQETFRIFTSDASDIANDRTGLSIMAVAITTLLLVLSIVFWFKKPTGNKRR